MRATAVAALCLLGLSCGGSPPPAGTYQSGSRLHAHVYDGGGGATQFLYWFDEQLKLPCSFNDMGDGTFRCTPNPNAYASAVDDGYLDAGCTRRAVGLDAYDACTFAAPPFVQVVTQQAAPCSPSACQCPADTYAWFPLGAEQHGVTTFYTKGADGSCTANPIDPGLGPVRVFALGAAADPSTFVGASLTTEARGPSLDLQVRVGDDGSRETVQIVDHGRGAPCDTPDPTVDGFDLASQHRCLAYSALGTYDSGWFTDPSCTTMGQQYAYSSPPCGQEATLLYQPGNAFCPWTYQVVELGPRVLDPSLYYGTPGNCTSVGATLLGSLSIYPETTTTVDLTTFPATVVARLGEGPLQAPVLAAADDPQARPLTSVAPFIDTKRDALCTPTPFKDGAIRCVTNGTATIGGYFADGACTQPLAYSNNTNGCAAPREAIDSSTLVSQVVQVKSAYGGLTFAGSGAGCTAVTPMGTNFFVIGAAVDPDTVFPRITERTEGDPTPTADAGTACNPCTDGIKDGHETDVDCGGGTCPACASGKTCSADADCSIGKCNSGVCASQCSDGVLDGKETAIDCGGGTCPGCADGETCNVNGDCQHGDCVHFKGVPSGLCYPSACASACGPGCPPCAVGAPCAASKDCASTLCLAGVCAPLNGCDPATAVDLTATSNVTIAFGGSLGNVYSPSCVLVSGMVNGMVTVITFDGDFSANPLQGGVVQGGVEVPATMGPLPTNPGGLASGTTQMVPASKFGFPAASGNGFYSIPNGLNGMKGAIFVAGPPGP